MISTIVFDFDGTLVDSNGIKRQGFFDVVARYESASECMASVLAHSRGDRRSILSAYRQEALRIGLGPLPPLDELVQFYSDHVDRSVASAPEMTGASALLRELRRAGRRIYLSSATPLINLRWVIEQRLWRELFDDVFGHPASKKETLLSILSLHGMGASDLAVVGDGEDDRDSAAAAGCAFFPVGEARGTARGERVFTLPELQQILTGQVLFPC